MVPQDRICRICGAELTRGTSGYVCGKCRHQSAKEKWQTNWSSYLHVRLRIARSRAKRKKLDFNIDLDYCMSVLVDQDYRCAITGLPFTRSASGDDMDMTIDRVDSDLGYIQGNVSLIGYRVNQMKSDLTHQKLLWWCKTIANHDTDRTSS